VQDARQLTTSQLTLLAIARMGHLTTPDGGKSFALRGN